MRGAAGRGGIFAKTQHRLSLLGTSPSLAGTPNWEPHQNRGLALLVSLQLSGTSLCLAKLAPLETVEVAKDMEWFNRRTDSEGQSSFSSIPFQVYSCIGFGTLLPHLLWCCCKNTDSSKGLDCPGCQSHYVGGLGGLPLSPCFSLLLWTLTFIAILQSDTEGAHGAILLPRFM